MDAMTMAALLGALGMGAIIGTIPAIAGAVKGKIGLGIGGFASCVVGNFLLGLLLSIPICALFMYFIFKKPKEEQPTVVMNTPVPSYFPADNQQKAGMAEQLQKLSELKEAGILSEEEFKEKKEQLLSKLG